MKWRSKATGVEYDVYDAWTSAQYGYRVSLKLTGEKATQGGPILTYSELAEAFEKVEDEKPIREGMYDGWDTE